jgi:hypothetical protein
MTHEPQVGPLPYAAYLVLTIAPTSDPSHRKAVNGSPKLTSCRPRTGQYSVAVDKGDR